MLHRMPKPGDVIQQLSADVKIFVLSCSGGIIDKRKRENADVSYCIISALTSYGSKLSGWLVFYKDWFFLIDSMVSNTNNISEE